MSALDGWVPVGVISELTSFAPKTLYRMAREGRIPAHRQGRSVKFDIAEVKAWMAKAPRASS